MCPKHSTSFRCARVNFTPGYRPTELVFTHSFTQKRFETAFAGRIQTVGACAMPAEDPDPLTLFRKFPQLVARGHYVSLGVNPSPIEHCQALEGAEAKAPKLYVKRDDKVSSVHGGNKARKMEFLLGQATAKGAGLIASGGATESNQALALAVFCRHLGLDLDLVLWKHPPGIDARARQLKLEKLGATVRWARGSVSFGLLLGWRFLRASMRARCGSGRHSWLILPGGSNSWSSLAYVNAGLELAEQVQQGQAPCPDAVYVPVGSGGTMAGLVVGMRLAGLSSRVVGVQVADPPFCTSGAVCRLANRTLQSLRAWGCEVPTDLRIVRSHFSFLRDYRGQGYARRTVAGQGAVQRAAQVGLRLESTYTGKAFAAFLDAAASATTRDNVLLFFHTANSQPLPESV